MNAKALAQVLSLSSKQYSTNITKIKLNDNSLVSSRGMHPMIWMKGLKEVDLRTNEVKFEYILNVHTNDIKHIFFPD